MGLCPSSALLPHNPWRPAFSGLFKTRPIAFHLCYRPRYQPKIGDQRSLAYYSRLPLSTWSYQAQGGETRHMGPMAQDFHAAFGLGEDERYISSVDADGVTLAAIQGLYQLLLEKDREMEEFEEAYIYIELLRNQNKSLERELRAVEQVVAELAEKVGN